MSEISMIVHISISYYIYPNDSLIVPPYQVSVSISTSIDPWKKSLCILGSHFHNSEFEIVAGAEVGEIANNLAPDTSL